LLSQEQEKELEEWLIMCAEMGDPKMKFEIMKAAEEILKLSSNPRDKFKNVVPSSKWFSGFLKRHRSISIRTAETISRASSIVSESDIRRFFDQLDNFLRNHLKEEEYEQLLNDSSRWINSDETGFELNPKSKMVFTRKGSKNVYRVDASKPKESITVTYTFVADGTMLNPVILFKNSCSKMQDIAFTLGGIKSLL
jgi:hypothetical protein